MTRLERRKLETRRHDSVSIKYFVIVFAVGFVAAIISLIF